MMSHICPVVPPPQGIGQRSKVVVLPTSEMKTAWLRMQGDEGDAGEGVPAAAALCYPGEVQQEQAVHGQAAEDVSDGTSRQDCHR